MPKYQYQCTQCGEPLEVQQSFTDDALTVCPLCSGKLRKVFNAVGVVFKGSGFYRNDSRSTSTPSETAKPAAKEGSSTSSGDTSASSTPSSNKPSSSTPSKKSGSDSAA
ncbi:FmdB family zinc ribbon protein [Aeromicrobium sp.]|uniref:FmdB family zinc ribbon protein n=1 Tax=Aeromicrobium sp. TaxID=1871063 RepID=UPI0019A580D9|nr:FmdB family zinc ribbon protein [Aeromicrobium sp.]MBC7631713.1 FmdB family transcriptional regulator [Aeromicrobium sp.]